MAVAGWVVPRVQSMFTITITDRSSTLRGQTDLVWNSYKLLLASAPRRCEGTPPSAMSAPKSSRQAGGVLEVSGGSTVPGPGHFFFRGCSLARGETQGNPVGASRHFGSVLRAGRGPPPSPKAQENGRMRQAGEWPGPCRPRRNRKKGASTSRVKEQRETGSWIDLAGVAWRNRLRWHE
jgi:hypothetical protein